MYAWVRWHDVPQTFLTLGSGYGWLPTINGGSLLLKPNKALLSHMLEISPIFKYDTVFAEQSLLQGMQTLGIEFYMIDARNQ